MASGSRGVLSTVVNLFVCMVGLGLLAFPNAAGGAGGLLSIVFLVVYVLLFLTGTLLLGRITSASGCTTYQGAAALYLGSKSGYIMQFFYILTGFLAVQNYMIVATDAFEKFDFVTDSLSRAEVCAVVAVLMIPCCMLRTLGALRFTSAIAMCGIFMVFAAMCYDVAQYERHGATPAPANASDLLAQAAASVADAAVDSAVAANESTPRPDATWLPRKASLVLQMPPLLAGAFTCQVNAIRGLSELQHKERYTNVVMLVGISAGAFYALFTIIGVWAYGADAKTDVQSELTGVPGKIAQVTTAITCILKAPFLVQPCRGMFFGIARAEETTPRLVVVTLLYLAFCYSIAFSVTNFGSAFALLGGTCGVAVAMMFPGAICVCYAREPKVSDDPQENTALLPGGEGKGPSPTAGAVTSRPAYATAGYTLLVGGGCTLVCMVASLIV